MQSLTFSANAGRVDTRRVLVLRTASDYTMPGDDTGAASLLAQDASKSGESAYREALEAAYGSAVPSSTSCRGIGSVTPTACGTR